MRNEDKSYEARNPDTIPREFRGKNLLSRAELHHRIVDVMRWIHFESCNRRWVSANEVNSEKRGRIALRIRTW